MTKVLALLAGGLHQGGGVPTVAGFVRDVALMSDAWHVRSISLCMSPRDPENTSVLRPWQWRRAPTVGKRVWLAEDVSFVGARFGELEFQRYRPRQVLTKLLEDCDVVQVVAGSPAWANAVVGLGKPVSLQVATRAIVERQQRATRETGALALWRRAMTHVTDRLDDQALRSVDAIQVENPWMLDYAQEINADRANVDIRYAPPGLNTNVFQPLRERDLSINPYILCVGRLDDPRKRIDLLLEAYAMLAPGVRENSHLALAGSREPCSDFWLRAEMLGVREHITFVASPDEDTLVSLYQNAAVFVLSSDEEGFGMVVIEAMACAVPVVATRCGGPDGIITDGVDGFLVPRGDAAMMADRIAMLLRDDALNVEMGAAARVTVENRYEKNVAGMAFLDVWDRLLHGARR